jgi:hypothetical protein
LNPPRSQRLWTALSVAIVLIVGDGLARAREKGPDSWRITPWLDLDAGYETEAIVDPLLGRASIPGGPFLGFTPGVVFQKNLGARNTLEILANGSLERFFEDDGRTLMGLSSWAEFSMRSRRLLYGRLAAGVEYYDDTGMDTAERVGVGGRFAVGLGGARSGGELGGTVRGRRYPNLITEDADGSMGTYTETLASIGLSGWTALGRRWLVQGELDRQINDARDPLFDTVSWLFRAGLRVFTGRNWTTWISGLYQLREYEQREAGLDEDSYLQAGIRVTRAVGSRQSVGLAYSYLVFVDTLDLSDDSHRVSMFYAHRFGGPVTGEPIRLAANTRAAGDPVVTDGLVRFRILAGDAEQVSVAGDFNGWSAAANPLSRRSGDWWETTLTLPPGSYQFIYVVDGQPTTPPRAATTVDDGFGGTNGLFTVLEP